VSLIELQTYVAAPPERCFDLSRSVELHVASAAATGERVVAGPTSGLLAPGEIVTWEARHLGLRRRLTVQITGYERPNFFRDEMVSGPLRRMRHEHWFEAQADGTRMRDAFEFASVFPLLDALVLEPHLRKFLVARNETIRRVAESDEWRRYLTPKGTCSTRSY
jgi:ligand-binding SRPBCC domain-containing protein